MKSFDSNQLEDEEYGEEEEKLPSNEPVINPNVNVTQGTQEHEQLKESY